MDERHTKLILRLSGVQHASLMRHLFPGDGKESVAVALCGSRMGSERLVLCLHQIKKIPDSTCIERTPVSVTWPIEPIVPFIAEAERKHMAMLKIHSHPTGYSDFSSFDDASDATLLGSLAHLIPINVGHISAIMMPDGTIYARRLAPSGKFEFIDVVVVVDDEVRFYNRTSTSTTITDDVYLRTKQAFGEGTTSILKGLRIGVVGCSGTGSWVVEMLARLGAGEIVLVDPDKVERKNLNRIINSTSDDAAQGRPKVDVLARAIKALDIGTETRPFPDSLLSRETVYALAECDFLFGCVDSADGRDVLNRIAAFYLVPYIDVGVHLQADGKGSVTQICAAVHYLLPGGSSLLSRGVITSEQVRAQALQRKHPAQYEALRKEGYIQGAAVDSPAVISVNGFAASHAVNEMLARLHPFRRDPNSEYRHQIFSLSDGAWLRVADENACPLLSRRTGRGDCHPLLDDAELT